MEETLNKEKANDKNKVEEMLPEWIKVIYEPKSVVSLLVVSGIIFIFFSGVAMPWNTSVAQFFEKWGKIFLTIGLAGWAFFILPTIIRNLQKL